MSHVSALLRLAKCDLLLTVNDNGKKMDGAVLFRKHRFSTSFVECLSRQYTLILEEFATNPGSQLNNLKLMSDEERKRVVYDWNQTEAPFASDSTAHEVFQEVAAEHADDIALEFEDSQLSYKELNAKANQLANAIRSMVGSELDANRNSVIALYLDRGLDMVVSILGVMKSGAGELLGGCSD